MCNLSSRLSAFDMLSKIFKKCEIIPDNYIVCQEKRVCCQADSALTVR